MSRLKYDFIVRPGADSGRIRLAYRGATDVCVTGGGDLRVVTPAGAFEDQRPIAFQEIDGRSTDVPVAYTLDADAAEGARAWGFELGSYDPTRSLVIDPALLIYCGYIGGSDRDSGADIAVDDEGNAYLVGTTSSDEATLPVAAGPDLTYNGGDLDAFVTKVPKYFACQEGAVNLGAGGVPANVLSINASGGSPWRTVTVGIGEPIEVYMALPPGGPDPARFALYLWKKEPKVSTIDPQPANLGDMCFPTFLTGNPPLPNRVWNNIGKYPKLGTPNFPSDPAPSIVLSSGSGVGYPVIVTLQGFIQDNASTAEGPASITNAVALRVQ